MREEHVPKVARRPFEWLFRTWLVSSLASPRDVVRNEVTGESSSADDEKIRLCVSTPLSDVILDL